MTTVQERGRPRENGVQAGKQDDWNDSAGNNVDGDVNADVAAAAGADGTVNTV